MAGGNASGNGGADALADGLGDGFAVNELCGQENVPKGETNDRRVF